MIQEAVDGQAFSAKLSLIIVVNTVARTRGRQPSRSPGHRLGLDAKRPFRWNVQHHTKLGAQVRRSVAAGELVGDDLVEKVVHRRLSEHDWNFGFIVDGFPRNQPQARFFLESYDLDAVILLEVPDELVKERILSRRLCSRCGLDYNLISSRPAVAETCDLCGGRLVARADDTPEAVHGRLRDYHEKTRPVLDLFCAKEVIVAVDATGPVAEMQAAICGQLGSRRRPPDVPPPTTAGACISPSGRPRDRCAMFPPQDP